MDSAVILAIWVWLIGQWLNNIGLGQSMKDLCSLCGGKREDKITYMWSKRVKVHVWCNVYNMKPSFLEIPSFGSLLKSMGDTYHNYNVIRGGFVTN